MTNEEVMRLHNAGLNIIPVTDQKKAMVRWQPYIDRAADMYELSEFPFGDTEYVAVIAGKSSNNVECIDFDLKNDESGKIFKNYQLKIKEAGLMGLLLSCYVQSTPTGGYHLVYRWDGNEPNQKLARAIDKRVIIETRGHGGYFLIDPSPGYKVMHGSITDLPLLSKADRDSLINAAKALNMEEDHPPVKVPTVTYQGKPAGTHRATVERICKQAEENKINLTVDYDQWVKIGHALAHQFREEGRELFHRLSSIDPRYRYDETDLKYSNLLTQSYKDQMATIRSFYAIARDYGLDIKDDLEGVNPHAIWIRKKDIKLNVITRKLIYGDEEVGDYLYNELFTTCREQVGAISSAMFSAYLYNRNNVTVFNPVYNFFEHCRFRHYTGDPFGDYLGHLTLENPDLMVLIRKWILSVVAAGYGFVNDTVLVLTGDGNLGKTYLFKKLLPVEMQDYFTIKSLKDTKDDMILMCEKLIILDDEFGGSTWKDAKHFKALTSMEKFSVRAPYGRTNEDRKRLAVLCGSSNPEDIINDYTGNRRIIPVKVLDRDMDLADRIDRWDMWSQITQEYWAAPNDSWRLTKEEVSFVQEYSERHQTVNSEREGLTELYEPGSETDHTDFLTATSITNILSERFPNLRFNARQVGRELTQLGFRRSNRRIDGVNYPVYGYYVKEIGKKSGFPF